MLLRRCNGVLIGFLLCLTAQFGMRASELCVTVEDYAELPLPNAWTNVTELVRTENNTPAKTYNTSTDSKGKACVAVPEGMYSVEVGLTGFINVRYYPVSVTYPNAVELSFRLPNGPVGEGGVEQDAILSGILRLDGKAVAWAKICIRQNTDRASIVTCGLTNDFGEYALSVTPATYRIEIRTARGDIYRSTMTISNPGYHRNIITIQGASEPARQR